MIHCESLNQSTQHYSTMSDATLTNIKIENDDFEISEQLDLDEQYMLQSDSMSDTAESVSIKSEDQSNGASVDADDFMTTNYPVFTQDSIQVIAEQSDIPNNLSESAACLLAEDVSYRVRELVHCAGQFMRHSFRNKLTTKDVSKAMQELDCDIVFGHNNAQNNNQLNKSLHYQYVPQANVFVESVSLIDLKEESSRTLQESLNSNHYLRNISPTRSIMINWFQASNHTCDKFDQNSNDSSQIDIHMKYLNLIKEICSSVRSSKLSHISLHEQKRLLKVVYYDLSKNNNLRSHLCTLINFIDTTLRKWNRLEISTNLDLLVFSHARLNSYIVLLETIHAIIKNPYFIDLALDSKILEQLCEILLFVCFDTAPIPAFQSSHSKSMGFYLELYVKSLKFRAHCAHIYSQILFKFCLPFTDIQHRLISLISIKIRHIKSKLKSDDQLNISLIHYSILQFHRYCGFDICLRFLQPLLLDPEMYFNSYLTNDPSNECSIVNSKQNWAPSFAKIFIQGEIRLVGELILKGFSLMMAHMADDFVLVDQSNEIYLFYAQHFGDSLSARLSPLTDLPNVQQNLTTWIRNWQSQIEKTKKNKFKNTVGKVQDLPVRSMSQKIGKTRRRGSSESSSNRTRKKKGTGLLESMLSADTSKMAKNESLSMFTESLLEASHRQYEKVDKTVLYQEDSDEVNGASTLTGETTNSAHCLVVFEGKRLPKTSAEDVIGSDSVCEGNNSNEATSKPVQNTYKQSKWYHLSVNYKSKKPSYLPGFYGPWLYESLNVDTHSGQSHDRLEETTSEEPSSGALLSATYKCRRLRQPHHPMRHKAFHYHRIRNHLRTNFSLFTML